MDASHSFELADPEISRAEAMIEQYGAESPNASERITERGDRERLSTANQDLSSLGLFLENCARKG
jgi:hypothetical protein